MIDPIGFALADFACNRAFHIAALAPLGFGPVMDAEQQRNADRSVSGFHHIGRLDSAADYRDGE